MKEYFAKLKYLFKWRDVAFTVLIFAIILTMAFCMGKTMMDVTFGETALDITTSRYSMNIPYDMVKSVELGRIDGDDELLSGVADIALRTGQWKNEVWGEYSACMDVQTDNCVLVHLNDGRLFVFSYESNETNEEAYETLLSKIS